MALIPMLVDFFDDPIIQLIVISLTFGIGSVTGNVILGRAILQRFPRLTKSCEDCICYIIYFVFN